MTINSLASQKRLGSDENYVNRPGVFCEKNSPGKSGPSGHVRFNLDPSDCVNRPDLANVGTASLKGKTSDAKEGFVAEATLEATRTFSYLSPRCQVPDSSMSGKDFSQDLCLRIEAFHKPLNNSVCRHLFFRPNPIG